MQDVMSVKVTMKPKLRFGEFDGEWEASKLKTLCQKIMVGIASSATHAYAQSGIPMIRNQNIKEEGLDDSDLMFITEEYEKAHKNKRLRGGDILTVRTGYPGLSCVVPEKYTNAQCFTSLIIRPKPEMILSAWLVHYINSPIGKQRMFAFEAGGAQKNINAGSLENLIVPVVSLPEQTKIAGFLSAVDGKIQQLTRKKALLEQYKKGVMQQLFSQEIRFTQKDGKAFPEWEEKRLGEIGLIITGKTPLTANEDLWGGDVQFITPTDIHEDRKYQNITARQVQRNGKMKLLPPNSIVYTCIASIGKMALTVHPAITNQQINAIVPEPTVSNEYVYYVLLHMTPKIRSTQANTTLPIINKTDFSQITIPLPCLEEQQRIAGFLSALDGRVATVGKQLEKTVQWKRGLLQQMFV